MEIKIDYIKTILLIFGGLLLIASSIYVLDIAINYYYYGNEFGVGTYISRNPMISISVSMIGLVFFSIGVIYLFYKLLLKRTILKIDRNGIVDCSTIASLGVISWDVVMQITPLIVGKQKMIGVGIKNVDKLLVGKVWYKQRLTRANMACGYSPITINLNSTKENVDDVILMMNYYLEEWRNTHEAIKDEKDNFANSVLNQNILE